MKVLYFDNAATSWPKPPAVLAAMRRYFRRVGGNPGRSGHARAVEAGRLVLQARERLAELLGVRDPARVVFTKNATEALNMVIYGLVRPGDRVVASSLEHNSVLRPLSDLAGRRARLVVVEADRRGVLDPQAFCRQVEPGTRLAVVTHASNVAGTVTDIRSIGEHCRRQGVPLLVDAAQTAGCLPINFDGLPVDYLAASGHKGLLGPQGTGLLVLREAQGLPPLLRGGTGSLSDREEQPEFLPDRLESGTLNVIGIAGLAAGAEFLLRREVGRVAEHDRRLLAVFLEELEGAAGVRVHGPAGLEGRTGVLSVTVEQMSCSEVGERLENRFGVLTRIGLHCAPRAHRTLDTFPDGTVRFSWGVFTRPQDARTAARALRAVAGGRR